MEIKIKEIYGYNLFYNEGMRRFIVKDTDGTELAFAGTQDGAEVKAKTLSKQEFKRMRIVRVREEGLVTMGELTSLNKDDKTIWVSMEKSMDSYRSGREKVGLVYDREFYEATEANLKVVEDIKVKKEALDQIKLGIKILIATLEKPINLNYFGINKEG